MRLAQAPFGQACLTTKTAAGRQEAASGHSLPQLSKKLAQQHSHGNLLFVTWANQHYVPFAANWAYHARAAGINNFLVGGLLPCACACSSGLRSCWKMMAAVKQSTSKLPPHSIGCLVSCCHQHLLQPSLSCCPDKLGAVSCSEQPASLQTAALQEILLLMGSSYLLLLAMWCSSCMQGDKCTAERPVRMQSSTHNSCAAAFCAGARWT